jgi:hypothetical protein
LKARRKAAGFPWYLISINSLSVSTLARRHSLEKTIAESTWLIPQVHQNQFRQIPSDRTYSVTASGVSAAKVVATMELPITHQGSFLPERKYS